MSRTLQRQNLNCVSPMKTKLHFAYFGLCASGPKSREVLDRASSVVFAAPIALLSPRSRAVAADRRYGGWCFQLWLAAAKASSLIFSVLLGSPLSVSAAVPSISFQPKDQTVML